MEYTKYITKMGDTWTGIAFKAYGDVNRCIDILNANPTAPGEETLPGDIVLNIPIQEITSKQAALSSVPPWKRK